MLNATTKENNTQFTFNGQAIAAMSDDDLALAIKTQLATVNFTHAPLHQELLDALVSEQSKRPVKTHPILLKPEAPTQFDHKAIARDAHIKFGVEHAKLNHQTLAVFENPKTGAVQIRDFDIETCPNLLAIITSDGRVESFEAGVVCVSKQSATVFKLVSNPVYDERLGSTIVRGVALSGRRRGMTSILPVAQLETVREAA